MGQRRTMLAGAAVLAFAFSFQLPAQSSASTPKPLKIVTSVAVWADIAQTIGGSDVTASAIISRPGQDPHSYEATVRDQLAVNLANLTITNGADYDPFFAKLVARKPSHQPGMDLTLAGHINQHTPSPNPHLWYDLGYVKTLAAVIGKAEQQALPSRAAAIGARLTTFEAQLDGLLKTQRTIATKTVGKGALLTESFALRMLRNLAVVDETPAAFRQAVEQDQDAAPGVMAAMRNLMSHGRVRVLIMNVQTQGAQTNQLAAWAVERHVPVLKLSELLPQHQHYIGWMASNLDQIRKALL